MPNIYCSVEPMGLVGANSLVMGWETNMCGEGKN